MAVSGSLIIHSPRSLIIPTTIHLTPTPTPTPPPHTHIKLGFHQQQQQHRRCLTAIRSTTNTTTDSEQRDEDDKERQPRGVANDDDDDDDDDAKGFLLSGVAEEVREIQWPQFAKVLSTTGVVLYVILGSSAVLLTVNAVLSELSDRVFAGKGLQDFFSG